jgi:TRAP-type C4-dicarboxylate transport system permease small subunit
MEFYRRLDRAWARGEGVLTLSILLSMVFVACFSAGMRNLTRFDITWANALLTELDWTDSFLHKATTLLAFLGASQAAYYHKHISIDVLTRVAPLRVRYVMHAASGIIAGAIAIALAYSLAAAVALNLAERPIEYELLGTSGAMHICDAPPAQLSQLDGVERPPVFCALRRVLKVVGIRAETPGAAFQLVVPLIFLGIGVRFLARGIISGRAAWQGEAAMNRLEAEERARLAAVHARLDGGDATHEETGA